MPNLYDLFLEISKTQAEHSNLLHFKSKKKIDSFYNRLINESKEVATNSLLIVNKNFFKKKEDNTIIKNVELDMNSFFTYDYCGHIDEWIITEHKSIAEAYKYIINAKNDMFSTYIFLFKNNKHIKYKL